MSDTPQFTPEITSPTLPTNEGVVRSMKEFSDALTLDLTDDEIQRAFKIVLPIISKWQNIFRTRLMMSSFKDVEDAMKLVEDFEDEVKTTFMEQMDLLVGVDVMDVFEGGYPTIVFEGALSSHATAKYGMDHEKKEFEVKRAKERGEVFLGAKEVQ